MRATIIEVRGLPAMATGSDSSMHCAGRTDYILDKISTGAEFVKLELLALLQQALVQSDEAGLDFVSIRISEAIDLLTVEPGGPEAV